RSVGPVSIRPALRDKRVEPAGGSVTPHLAAARYLSIARNREEHIDTVAGHSHMRHTGEPVRYRDCVTSSCARGADAVVDHWKRVGRRDVQVIADKSEGAGGVV